VTEQRRSPEIDDLLKPSVEPPARRPGDALPWRLGSIVYVAFFGGAAAAAAISVANAQRLGLPRKVLAQIAALGVAGVVGVIAVAEAVGDGDALRVAIRAVALAAYGGMYLLQRSADRIHHFHQQDPDAAYESLWGPGLLAVFTFGLAETVLAVAVAG
jgi:hypothetical protein